MNQTNQQMCFDESQMRLMDCTDITQCDLETKSILKPAKIRAPLQEVDLGLDNYIDKDIIRKRRVSFAGVNKIKEFHSKAESVIICSTPAYEETFSTSSDSSALTSSGVKDDCTLLNDTMELTDLSVDGNPAPQVDNSSAMDFTSLPKSFQGPTGASGQKPFSDFENIDPLATEAKNVILKEAVKSDLFGRNPLFVDPTKILIRELLDDSRNDDMLNHPEQVASAPYNNPNSNPDLQKRPVHRNSIFDPSPTLPNQDKHHVNDSQKSTCMQLTEVVNADSCQGVKNWRDAEPMIASDTSRPSQHTNTQGRSGETLVTDKRNFPALAPDATSAVPYVCTNDLLDTSQVMDFTETLKPHKINLDNVFQNPNPKSDNAIYQNINNCENTNSIQNNGNEEAAINYKCSNVSSSVMEFPDALPGNICTRKDATSQRFPILNQSMSMEFTEAIPQNAPHQRNTMTFSKNLNTSEQSFNMEFTEAVPAIFSASNKPLCNGMKENKNNIDIGKNMNVKDGSEVGIFPTNNQDLTQMEFTEAIPAAYTGYKFPHSNHCEQDKPPFKISQTNRDTFQTGKVHNQNLFSVEFNGSIPVSNHQANFPYGGEQLKSTCGIITANKLDTTQMELTEAIPTAFPMPNLLSSKDADRLNYQCEIVQPKKTDMTGMEFTEAVPTSCFRSELQPCSNTEQFKGECEMDISQMDFTEAAPAALRGFNLPISRDCDKQKKTFGEDIRNVNKASELQKEFSQPNAADISQMEFTEAIPAALHRFNLRTSEGCEQERKSFGGDKRDLNKDCEVQKEFIQQNTADMSQMELTEAIPAVLRRFNLPTSKGCEQYQKSFGKDKNDLNKDCEVQKEFIQTNAADMSQMEFTEAIPAALRGFNLPTFKGCEQQQKSFGGDKSDLNKDCEVQKEFIQTNAADTSQMEFTEAIPAALRGFNLPIPKDCLQQKITFCEDKRNINQALEVQKEFSQPNAADMSNMEFTEAIPATLRGLNLPTSRDCRQQENTFCADKRSQSKVSEVQKEFSQSKVSDMSQMEFTEAIPSALRGYNLLTSKDCEQQQKSFAGDKRDLNKDCKVQNDFSQSNAANMSQMEFTEAIPAALRGFNLPTSKGCEVQRKSFSEDKRDLNNVREVHKEYTQTNAADMSQMEFTEAIPAALRGFNLPTSKGCEVQRKSFGEDKRDLNNVREVHKEYTQTNAADMSQMEFTEAIPAALRGFNLPTSKGCEQQGKSLGEDNRGLNNVHEVQKEYTQTNGADMSQMEFTEAIPAALRGFNLPTFEGCERQQKSFDEDKRDLNNVHDVQKEFIQSNAADMSQMEFTEAIPAALRGFNLPTSRNCIQQQNTFGYDKGNINNFCEVEKELYQANATGKSQMEFTEAVPAPLPLPISAICEQKAKFLAPDKLHKNKMCDIDKDIPQVKAPDISQMEFTEAIPSKYKCVESDLREKNSGNPVVNMRGLESTGAVPPAVSSCEFPGFSDSKQLKPATSMVSNADPTTQSRQPSLTHTSNLTHMEFTEVVPTAYFDQKLPNNDLKNVGKLTGEVTNNGKSRDLAAFPISKDATQMEFTEAIATSLVSHKLTCSDGNNDKTQSKGNVSIVCRSPEPGFLPDIPDSSQKNFNEDEPSQFPEKGRENEKMDISITDSCDNGRSLESFSKLVSNAPGADPNTKLLDFSLLKQVETVPDSQTAPQLDSGRDRKSSHSDPSVSSNVKEVRVVKDLSSELSGSDVRKSCDINRPDGNEECNAEIDESLMETDEVFHKPQYSSDHFKGVDPPITVISDSKYFQPVIESKNTVSKLVANSSTISSIISDSDSKSAIPEACTNTQPSSIVSANVTINHEVSSDNRKSTDPKQSFEQPLLSCNSNFYSNLLPSISEQLGKTQFDLDRRKEEVVSSEKSNVDHENLKKELCDRSENGGNIILGKTELASHHPFESPSLCDVESGKCEWTASSHGLPPQLKHVSTTNSSNPDSRLTSEQDYGYESDSKVHVSSNTPDEVCSVGSQSELASRRCLRTGERIVESIEDRSACFRQRETSASYSSRQESESFIQGYNIGRGGVDDDDNSGEIWKLIKENREFLSGLDLKFVSPTLWKYCFPWGLDLVVELPLAPLDTNTDITKFSLVTTTNINNALNNLADRCMRKSMSLILSEAWLSSECKTLKDLRVALKLVDEEYARLHPLINSLKLLYQRFPFSIHQFRVQIKIVNLKVLRYAEIEVNVSNYKNICGKDVTLVNSIGDIRQSQIQQLFDSLMENESRFVNLVEGVHRLLGDS